MPPGNYTLRLRAVNSGGASPASNPVTVTVPSACEGPPEVPSNVLGYRIGNSAFVVWDPPATGPAASSYVLLVSGSFVGSFATARAIVERSGGPGFVYGQRRGREPVRFESSVGAADDRHPVRRHPRP